MIKRLRGLLIWTGLLSVGAGIWLVLWYQPKNSEIQETRKQIEVMSQRVRAATISQRYLDTLRVQNARIRATIEEKDKRVWPKSVLPRIADQLQRLARRSGLTVRHVLPDFDSLLQLESLDSEGAKKPVFRLPVRFVVEGRYRNFGRFLEQTEGLPFLFSVGDFQVRYQEMMYPNLSIGFTGFMFLRDEGSPAASSGTS